MAPGGIDPGAGLVQIGFGEARIGGMGGRQTPDDRLPVGHGRQHRQRPRADAQRVQITRLQDM